MRRAAERLQLRARVDLQHDQRVLLLRGRRLPQLAVEIAGEAFAVEGTSGPLAAALEAAWSAFLAHGAFAGTVRFHPDARAVPTGVRTMPVVRGPSITGDGFEAVVTGNDAVVHGANERFGIESVLKVLLARALLPRGALLVHAVAVANGCVFTGESGAGKSTLGALCADTRLADELVVLGADGIVYGTPWNVGRAGSAPLRLLGTLGWAAAPRLEPVSAADFLPLLMGNTLLPDETPQARAAVFQLASKVLAAHPPRRFFFAPDPSARDFLQRYSAA